MKYRYVVIAPDEDGRILNFCETEEDVNRLLIGDDEEDSNIMEENPEFVTEDEIADHDFSYEGHVAVLEIKRVVVPKAKKVATKYQL
jgi:hypothetical protein